MIRQSFHVRKYWKVIVYYNLDYDLFHYVSYDLDISGFDDKMVDEVYGSMHEGKAKAVTLSNLNKHISVVLFNVHKDRKDYINSLIHEAEHIKQAMLKAYQVEDRGEPPAYTIGYLVSRMWEVFKNLTI